MEKVFRFVFLFFVFLLKDCFKNKSQIRRGEVGSARTGRRMHIDVAFAVPPSGRRAGCSFVALSSGLKWRKRVVHSRFAFVRGTTQGTKHRKYALRGASRCRTRLEITWNSVGVDRFSSHFASTSRYSLDGRYIGQLTQHTSESNSLKLDSSSLEICSNLIGPPFNGFALPRSRY